MSEQIPTRIVRMDPRALKLLELNARFMRHETYQRLVENIRRDGKLTSVPFAALVDGRYEVLSGNHRVKAAIDAGLAEIDVMVTDAPLTRQQRVAIQLSHNAIVGEDDPATLRRLYDELDVDWKVYSGLDDKTLQLIQEVQPGSLSEAGLEFQTLSLVFLPDELDRVKAAFERAKALAAGARAIWLAPFRAYDRFLDTLDLAASAHGISNMATSMMTLVAIVEAHAGDLTAGWLDEQGNPTHDADVPLATVLGNPNIPAATAAALRKAIDRMVSRGEVPAGRRWQAFDRLVARYMQE